MEDSVIKDIEKSAVARVSTLFFFALSAWWITIFFRGLSEGLENNIYTLTYPLLSLLGGIAGIVSAKKWGGWKSHFGRSVMLFSYGLLAQLFGQACYAYYIYIQGIEVPYPSIGDVGYFGSVLLYICAIITLTKVIGARIPLQSLGGKISAVLIPIAMLIFSYWFFLKDYQFDSVSPLQMFLDFGYPLGQAIYVSLAILALLLSRKYLGGIMRMSIIFIIFALIAQYFSDYTFLYQAQQGTWHVGGVNDYLYTFSYFFMTITLIYIGQIFNKIKAS